MQLRRSRVTRNGRTYEYLQLVESYRRESDGMPMHRVVANLGRADELGAENLAKALAATRSGKRIANAPAHSAVPPKPQANLRYLDLAVLLELWRDSGLDQLLSSLLPRGDAAVEPAAIVSSLVLQRCVEPGSKLKAARWFPRTALPELLGVSRESFNNTRVHRVLDDLEGATPELMRRLPTHFADRVGAFASLFLDVSDACFVGDGPSIAQRGKTKTGIVQRKIGIVLLCNEAGLPLRWDVIPGNQHDSVAMSTLVKSIAGLKWVGSAPVVMDRAMGKTAHVRDMLASGLRFLTALTVPEFESYSSEIPHQALQELSPRPGAEHRDGDVKLAAQRAEAAGLARVRDDLFVKDLGVVERVATSSRSAVFEEANADSAATAMRLCRQIISEAAEGRYVSRRAAGRAHGLGSGLTAKYCKLARLCEDIQSEVCDGKAACCSLAELISIAQKDPEQQRSAFEAAIESNRGRQPRSNARNAQIDDTPQDAPVRVRAVAYFNPERFVESRLRAERQRDEIASWVATVNQRLAKDHSKRARDAIAAAVDRKLREYDLISAYSLSIQEQTSDEEAPRCRIELKLDEAAWDHRRRFDGFSVLVGHPELAHSAAALCQLYRDKDAVEKDFQTIKSLVELEPVRHRVERKVRAHVTLCMLALALERLLGEKLRGRCTAEAALEALATCHLNQYRASKGAPMHVVTEPDPQQQKLLRALAMKHLTNDEEVAHRLS